MQLLEKEVPGCLVPLGHKGTFCSMALFKTQALGPESLTVILQFAITARSCP